MRYASVLAFGLLCSSPAFAQEWTVYGVAPRDASYYDPASVRMTPAGRYRVWTRIDHSRNPSRREREALRLVEIDCREGASRWVSAVLRDAGGQVISSVTNTMYGDECVYAPPGSVGATLLEAVCPSGQQR